MPSVKVKLDQKDPKKNSVKYSTSKDGAPISSIYVSNAAVEELGDPDEVTLTITSK